MFMSLTYKLSILFYVGVCPAVNKIVIVFVDQYTVNAFYVEAAQIST